MKQNKIIIGITGSIATGKSEAVKILKDFGYKVIDADEIAHSILNLKEVIKKIEAYFGKSVISNNGEVDRSKLGEIVFKDLNKLDKLNEITHSKVYEEIDKQIKYSNEKIIFVDIPLLIEKMDEIEDYNFKFDYIWLIYVNRDLQIERLMDRDNISKEYALKKMNTQIDIEEKKLFSSTIINNEGSKEELIKNISRELKKIMS